jgi:hypothetical protein
VSVLVLNQQQSPRTARTYGLHKKGKVDEKTIRDCQHTATRESRRMRVPSVRKEMTAMEESKERRKVSIWVNTRRE